MKTLKEFCAASNISEALIRATVRQFGGWESFKECASNVANHGISGGFHGFIYYADTVKFAKRNKSDILELCRGMASEIGCSGAVSLIASFNGMKGETEEDIAEGLYNPRSDNQQTVFNALAWFAGEEVCQSYCDLSFN